MERIAWKGYIKDGCLEEYKRRHNNIWPEMVVELKKAGIRNYTIFNNGNEMFGYYECEFGAKFANDYQINSEVVKKWEEYMKDILVFEKKDNDSQPKLVEVFRMD